MICPVDASHNLNSGYYHNKINSKLKKCFLFQNQSLQTPNKGSVNAWLMVYLTWSIHSPRNTCTYSFFTVQSQTQKWLNVSLLWSNNQQGISKLMSLESRKRKSLVTKEWSYVICEYVCSCVKPKPKKQIIIKGIKKESNNLISKAKEDG